MTIQEKILDQIPAVSKELLINSQITEANNILSRQNLKIKNCILSTLPISNIYATQSGDDYQNDSSKFDATIFNEVKNGSKNFENVRLESFRPIVVNKKSMEIIDGNHRHYALRSIGEQNILVLLCETEVIEFI